MTEEKQICGICIETFKDTSIPFEIKGCKHIFHKNCLENWHRECVDKQTPYTCPYCRRIFNLETLIPRPDLITKPSKKFQVFLRALDGRNITIEVYSDTTVYKFCQHVQVYTGINVNLQRFQCGTKSFSYDNHKDDFLVDLGVKDNSNIHLLLRLVG